MKQLLLDLVTEKPQTLDNFVGGTNVELMQLLHDVASGASGSPDRSIVYLWGKPGAGKTHLLRALAGAPRARYIAADADEAEFAFSPEHDLYLLDDCHTLAPSAQIAAFSLYNQVRENKYTLIAAGSSAPAALQVREDLRTRLGWGLIYQVHELTDDEKIAALAQSASARGLTLSSGVLPYLITHFRRDMRSLSAMLDALDQYSLETKRAITLPLLRDLLQQEKEITAP